MKRYSIHRLDVSRPEDTTDLVRRGMIIGSDGVSQGTTFETMPVSRKIDLFREGRP